MTTTTVDHELVKKQEAIPRPYVVEIGDTGPAQMSVSGLRSGGGHSFNRLTGEEADRRAVLRLTQSERASLTESGFTITEATAADLKPEKDVFDTDGDVDAPPPATLPPVTAADWPLKSTPIDYLTANPDGPKAELAQRMIDAGLGDVSA